MSAVLSKYIWTSSGVGRANGKRAKTVCGSLLEGGAGEVSIDVDVDDESDDDMFLTKSELRPKSYGERERCYMFLTKSALRPKSYGEIDRCYMLFYCLLELTYVKVD